MVDMNQSDWDWEDDFPFFETPVSPSLQKHDAIYHGGNYTGGKCKYRENMKDKDLSDILPTFLTSQGQEMVTARHGMFDNTVKSPQELDREEIEKACEANGIPYPRKGKVMSGRWKSPTDTRLEFTVVDPKTGLFVSGRAGIGDISLSRAEEAMSFSSYEDAEAVAKALSPDSKVLSKTGYKAFVDKPMANPVKFPETLSESDLDGFHVTLNGSTEPFVGKIGDTVFIAKRGSHTSDDHVANEHISNELHLKAGLRAPRSKVYTISGVEDTRTQAQKYIDEVNGKPFNGTEKVMLAEYIPNAISLDVAWHEAKKARDTRMKKKIRDEVLRAYPFESFIAGIDVFQNDNALVDGSGNVYFVDNGASFDYRARGGKKGWFNKRIDPEDKEQGFMSLLQHPAQTVLRDILKDVTREELIEAMRAYDFEKLVTELPAEYQTSELKIYAKKLNEMAEENNGIV